MADLPTTDGGLTVIYDSGRGVPASVYLSYLVSAGSPDGVMPGLRYPIRSRLAPGLLAQERQVFDPQWLAQPFFVIGADADSLRWLAFNRYRLFKLSAWGLVVQADSDLSFRAIMAIAPDLKFAPSSGAWFDDQLLAAGVATYPFLVDLDGVARQILPDDVYGPSGVGFADPVKPAPVDDADDADAADDLDAEDSP